jgi:hypothetical protein
MKEIASVFLLRGILQKVISAQEQEDGFCNMILLLTRNENGILRFITKEDLNKQEQRSAETRR